MHCSCYCTIDFLQSYEEAYNRETLLKAFIEFCGPVLSRAAQEESLLGEALHQELLTSMCSLTPVAPADQTGVTAGACDEFPESRMLASWLEARQEEVRSIVDDTPSLMVSAKLMESLLTFH